MSVLRVMVWAIVLWNGLQWNVLQREACQARQGQVNCKRWEWPIRRGCSIT